MSGDTDEPMNRQVHLRGGKRDRAPAAKRGSQPAAPERKRGEADLRPRPAMEGQKRGELSLRSSNTPAVGPLRGRDSEPLFQEPWQAQSLAVAARMVEAGYFSAADWSEALGAEIRGAARTEGPDDQASYYAAVIRALELLVEARGLVAAGDLAKRKAAWVRAYERTEHGRPVRLEAGG